jgi:hypothetical protein
MLTRNKLFFVVIVVTVIAAISWMLPRATIVALGQWVASSLCVGVLFRHLCGNPETPPNQHP